MKQSKKSAFKTGMQAKVILPSPYPSHAPPQANENNTNAVRKSKLVTSFNTEYRTAQRCMFVRKFASVKLCQTTLELGQHGH